MGMRVCGLVWGAAGAAMVLLAGARPCLAGCRDDFIMAVTEQGGRIATARSGLFQSLKEDLTDPGLWEAGQAVSICAYPGVGRLRLFTMTNLRRSESVMVTVPGAGVAGRKGR